MENKLEEFKDNKEKAAKYEQLMKEARDYSMMVIEYMIGAIDKGVKNFDYIDGLATESILANPYLSGCIWNSKVLNTVIPRYNEEDIKAFKEKLIGNKALIEKYANMVILKFETMSPDVELDEELDEELDDLKEGSKEETEEPSVHGFIRSNLKLPKESKEEKEEAKSSVGKIALGIAGVLGAVGLGYLGYKMFRD